MNNKVSIIIPTYNCAQHLQEAIDSALNQTYQNTEIIIIDDGSADSTGEILKSYISNKKIKIFHQSNQGLSAARNKGIELSTGAYITFLDSDDILDSKFCEYLMNKIYKHRCDIAMANFFEFNHEDELITIKNTQQEKIYVSLKGFANDREDYVARSTSWGKIYKRDIFNNAKFRRGAYHEDEFIFLDVFKQANIILYTKKQLYYYRKNKEGITKSKITNKKTIDGFNAFYYRIKQLHKLGFTIDDYAVNYSFSVMQFYLTKNMWGKYSLMKRVFYMNRYYYCNFLVNRNIKKIKYLILSIFPLTYMRFHS